MCVHEYTHTQTCVRFEAGSVCKCIIETHCAIPLPDFPHHEICISGGVSKGCIFIRVCARLCISETCVPVHEHLFVCVYMCKFLHMRMCIFACVGLRKCVLCGCVAQLLRVHVHAHVKVHICAKTHVTTATEHTNTCSRKCTCMCARVFWSGLLYAPEQTLTGC